MGDEDIRPVPVRTGFRQLLLTGGAAGLPAKASVDQKVPLSHDQITVQCFQGIALQGNLQTPKVFASCSAIRASVHPVW